MQHLQHPEQRLCGALPLPKSGKAQKKSASEAFPDLPSLPFQSYPLSYVQASLQSSMKVATFCVPHRPFSSPHQDSKKPGGRSSQSVTSPRFDQQLVQTGAPRQGSHP